MNAKVFFSLLLVSIASAAFAQETDKGEINKEPSWLHNKAERVAAFRNSQKPINTQPPADKNPETAWITDRSDRKAVLSQSSAPKAQAARGSQPETELASSSAVKTGEENPKPLDIEAILSPGALEQIRMVPDEKRSKEQP